MISAEKSKTFDRGIQKFCQEIHKKIAKKLKKVTYDICLLPVFGNCLRTIPTSLLVSCVQRLQHYYYIVTCSIVNSFLGEDDKNVTCLILNSFLGKVMKMTEIVES